MGREAEIKRMIDDGRAKVAATLAAGGLAEHVETSDALFVLMQAWSDEKTRERRERIATAALQGLISSTAEANGVAHVWAWDTDGAARTAVQHADALIAELDKEPAK